MKELNYKELNYFCDETTFKFETTKELTPSREIIGQGKTAKSLEFGLDINAKGYNIYLSGSTGTGKTSYVKEHLKKRARRKAVPNDWCYVYNFETPNQPLAISLPAGMGKVFVNDMDELIKTVSIEIPKAFDNNEYENEKNRILEEFQEKRAALVEKLNVAAEKQGFKVKTTPNGIYFLPIVNGEAISEEDFNNLEDSEKNKIMAKSGKIQLKTMDTIRKIKELEKKAEADVQDWENQTALFAVGVHVNEIMDKYKEYPKIINYLYDVQKDILDNLEGKDVRVKVFHKENGGTHSARNLGVEKSTGDYVMFIDPDDWFSKDCVESVVEIIKTTGADVVKFNYVKEYGSYFENKTNNLLDSKLYVDSEYKKILRMNLGLVGNELKNIQDFNFLASVCFGCYKKEIITSNSLAFTNMKEIGTFSDGLFNLGFLLKANSFYYLDKHLYHYRKNNFASCTNTYRANFLEKNKVLLEKIYALVNPESLGQDFKLAYDNRVSYNIF